MTSHVILRRWKDQYNGGDPQPDDLIFPSKPGSDKPLSYQGMVKIVKKAAERARIERDITNPTHFQALSDHTLTTTRSIGKHC
jgi:site-specific recombinase XerD